ncbi:MAG: ChaN family lipoprotein [Desulfobacterales bacterium]|nr:ChaN family lipoprotein [Desulfobacterales bacterium]
MLFRLTVIIPDRFSAISETRTIVIGPGPAPGLRQVQFDFPYPLDSINLVAGPYRVEEETLDSGVVLASYFFEEDRELAKGYRDQAKKYLTRYEKLLGPYPYKRFAIVENRLPTGYAMPTFTLLGQAVVRLPFIVRTSLGHEILHAWLGNSVRVADGSGNWAEGLTTYLADHALAADRGEDRGYRRDQILKYCSYVHSDNTITLAGFHGADDRAGNREQIRAVGYGKGALFFHLLRNKLGAQAFNAGLRDFYTRMRHRPAGWADLRASFEKTGKTDLKELFEQWLTRTDIPELYLDKITVQEKKGQPILSFVVVQGTAAPYDLTVPLVIRTPQGDIRRELTLTGKETPVSLPVKAVPAELILDPDADILRSQGPAELAPSWSRFDGAENKIAIIAADTDADRFGPLVEYLQQTGCTIINEADSDTAAKELASNAVLFLGQGRTSRSLFARAMHPPGGFTLDVRPHPLNPGQVAILVSTASRQETALALAKLRHYGKYSFLHFDRGRLRTKKQIAAEHGLRYPVAPPPAGIKTSRALDFSAIIDQLAGKRVIYVGENHTSYQDHQLQLRIIRALFARDPALAIGMEMFDRSTQQVLDDYLALKIEEREFLKKSNYFDMWRFDYRLYREIINFARRHQIPIIALNQKRKVVGSVFKNGDFKALTPEERAALPADRDLSLPGYRDRLIPFFKMHSGADDSGRFNGFIQAQALWDETMAEAAARYLSSHPDNRMVVIAGQGHVDKKSGIPPRLARRLDVAQAVVVNNDGREIDPATADYHFFSPPASLKPLPLIGVQLSEEPDRAGAVVTDLSPHGQAGKTGIRKNDLIIAIDDEPVTAVEDVKIIMLYKEDSESVRVRVRRTHALLPDETLEYTVPLKKATSPH